jgi:myo-inositol catabolism protein IolC
MKAVMKELQKLNINGSQLVEWPVDHCLDLESSTKKGRSCK